MTEQSLKEYFDMFTDCWKFFRQYSETNSDEEWKEFLCAAEKLSAKWNKRPFIRDLLCAVVHEINRLSTKKSKEKE